jgi:glucose dehydrogenase
MASVRTLLVRWHLLPRNQNVRIPPSPSRHLARLTFIAFLLTFIGSRVVVILIMTRHMPNLFFHAGGTHVHHLNYGIFLLSAVGALLLFASLNLRQKSICALVYGLAMGLTFDEFGMWLNLGGSYWQRASFDGVIVVLTILGLIAYVPRWERLRSHHYGTGVLLFVVVASFYLLLYKSFHHVNEKYAPVLMEIEESGPR